MALAVGAQACAQQDAAGYAPELGLMGSIPIYWGESADIGALLDGGSEPHWARARLESGYRLRPLDTLDARSLADLRFLMLAQPRPLSPEENVALDSWVRGGGRLLLFADPLLTGESRFAIGDRRRPQDVILLSPLLEHWGLTLQFDPEGLAGVRSVESVDGPIPVDLPGQFVADGGHCALSAGSLLARCAIGKGRAVILADAALLDLHHPHPDGEAAFMRLVRDAFATGGENAGH